MLVKLEIWFRSQRGTIRLDGDHSTGLIRRKSHPSKKKIKKYNLSRIIPIQNLFPFREKNLSAYVYLLLSEKFFDSAPRDGVCDC